MVLIQVALALLVLLGFCGLVVDSGVLWVARAQAQNAADSAALAGATSLAFDSLLDSSGAQQAALATMAQNKVWLQPAQPPSVTTSITLESACVVPGTHPPPTVGQHFNCFRVNVNRNQTSGNPLPTFFARLFNVTAQGVRAQATGTAAPANSTTCLWPLALPDRWGPATGTLAWSPTVVLPVPRGMFVKYAAYPVLRVPNNTYTQPTMSTAGTGYRILLNTLNVFNLASGLTLTRFDPAQFTNPAEDFGIAAGQFVSVAVPRAAGGGFADNLASCNGVPMRIGDVLALDNTGTLTEVTTAAAARRDQDSLATWNGVKVQTSCAASNPPCAVISPRHVVLPLFDVERFEDTRRTGTPEIEIVNFVGFFINTVTPSTSMQGYFTTYPGRIDPTVPQVQYLSAFLRAGVLIR